MMGLLEGHDCVLFDLDGVLYRGDRPVPYAAEAVRAVRAADRAVVFMTNNSSRTSDRVAAKLAGLGIAAEPDEVVTSALATAELLGSRGGGSVFLVGEDGIRTALADAGIRLIDGEPERVDHVVVGWDRSVDYAKLRTACLLVERGAHLVATNADPSFPAPDGLWPGAGAILAVITTTTGAEAEVVGKPHAPLFRTALRRAGGQTPLVVGDRLDTDIAGAAALGWDSLLVLTGISRREDLAGSGLQPTHVADDLRALLDARAPQK
ncbi:MAG TPA: HAD-IIA family hydrolase [Actinomycetota bacterium]